MPLTPPQGLDPERLLLYGPQGSGKTYAWLTLARWFQRQGMDVVFYVIDTDRTVDRMLATDFAELRNVQHVLAIDWMSMREALNKFIEAARPYHDWVVCDMLGPQTWTAVRRHFARGAHGRTDEELDDLLFSYRKRVGKTKQPLSEVMDGSWDWNLINTFYETWRSRLLLENNFHVVCVAGSEALNEKFDRKEDKALFRAKGQKAKGQKDTAFIMHTVIFVEAFVVGQPMMTTVKDRGRPVMDNTLVRDFALQYLIQRAGWSLT